MKKTLLLIALLLALSISTQKTHAAEKVSRSSANLNHVTTVGESSLSSKLTLEPNNVQKKSIGLGNPISKSNTLLDPKGLQLDSQTEDIQDTRAKAIENVFKRYDSPLVDEAKLYVTYADKYQIDWKLLPSISGLESTFGRFMMPGSHNAYGWGGGHIYFSSWEEGIDNISASLKTRYYDRGANTVETIGPIYAEAKDWAPRVTFFMNQIEEEHEFLTKTASLSI